MPDDQEVLAARAALWALARSTQQPKSSSDEETTLAGRVFRLRFRSMEDAIRLIGVASTPWADADPIQRLTGIPIDFDPSLPPNRYEVDLQP